MPPQPLKKPAGLTERLNQLVLGTVDSITVDNATDARSLGATLNRISRDLPHNLRFKTESLQNKDVMITLIKTK